MSSNSGKLDASEVAAYIVTKINEKGIYLDHLKLQKLLYFICLEWVKKFKAYPYKQATEMWKLGPVIRSVYSEYRTNGYNQITKVPSSLKFNEEGVYYVPTSPAEFSETEKKMVDEVLDLYGTKNSFDLVDLTHSHQPWARNESLINSGIYNIQYKLEDFEEIL